MACQLEAPDAKSTTHDQAPVDAIIPDSGNFAMSSHHPPALDLGASLPHPDSYVQELLRELSTALEAFKRERRGHDALAAVTKAFKRAAFVMDRCAPPPGEHEFIAGERVILCNLRQRGDLNGRLAIVKTKANVVDGDGRVEVSVGVGKKKEMIRAKPANLRLDWHVAADLHVVVPNSRVLVRSLESALRDQVCEVVCSDSATSQVTLRTVDSNAGGKAGGTVDVYVSSLVPATYVDVAREVHECAVKIALQAAGVPATPAVKAVISAVHSCAEFYIRCFRGSEASRICVSLMETLHVGGQSSSTPSTREQDYYERLAWISTFLDVCLHNIDDKLQRNGWYDDACSLLMQCKDVITSIQGSTSYNYFVLLNNLAGLHMKQHRLDEAEALYKEALRIRELNFHPLAGLREQESMIESCDVSIAATMHNLAMVHIHQHRFADAEVLYRKALQKQQAKEGNESLDVAATLHNLAVLHDKQARLEEAEVMYKESIRIRELIQGDESLDIATNLICLSMVYSRQSRFAEAEVMLKKALGMQQLKLGADTLDTSIADTMNNLAVLYVDQRRYSDAEEMYTQALRIVKVKRGPESLSAASVISNLAGLYAKVGRLEESETMFREAVRIKEQLFGRESEHAACEICNLAVVVCSCERWSEGEDLHKEALRIRESKLGRDSLSVAESLDHLGLLYMELGRVEDAEGMYQEALRIKELNLGHDHEDIVELRDRMAELHPPPLSDI